MGLENSDFQNHGKTAKQQQDPKHPTDQKQSQHVGDGPQAVTFTAETTRKKSVQAAPPEKQLRSPSFHGSAPTAIRLADAIASSSPFIQAVIFGEAALRPRNRELEIDTYLIRRAVQILYRDEPKEFWRLDLIWDGLPRATSRLSAKIFARSGEPCDAVLLGAEEAMGRAIDKVIEELSWQERAYLRAKLTYPRRIYAEGTPDQIRAARFRNLIWGSTKSSTSKKRRRPES